MGASKHLRCRILEECKDFVNRKRRPRAGPLTTITISMSLWTFPSGFGGKKKRRVQLAGELVNCTRRWWEPVIADCADVYLGESTPPAPTETFE